MTPVRPLAALALVLALPRPAAASKCLETSFTTQAKAADVIFVGHAREIDAELATTFEVERVYKGSAPQRVLVETFRNKYAMLEPPHRYLVLAGRDPDARPGALVVHACSGSRREPWPPEIINMLGKGNPPAPQASPGPTATPPDPPPEPDAVPATPSEPSPEPSATPPVETPPTSPDAPPAGPPPVPPRQGCTLSAMHHAPIPTYLLLVALAPRRRAPRRMT